jgi:hypothetical protein
MAGLSNAVENKVLDHLLAGTSYTPPDTLTIALVSTAVTESDTGSTITKVSYTGYADFALTHATHWNNAASGSKTNKAVLTWPENTGATTPTAVGFAVLNGTDIIVFGTLPSTAIAPNITPQFAINALTVTAD